ncbi:MAG TPA: hypothetical protein VFU98_13645 [Microlunatus sp.]|nr:hypothetical protein [Microlunatus sp.]
MLTPQVPTADRPPHRPSPSHHTTYERLLGSALAGAVAAVAALAIAVPSVSAATNEGEGPVMTSGHSARGKATVPSFAVSGRVPDAPAQL